MAKDRSPKYLKIQDFLLFETKLGKSYKLVYEK